MEGDLATITHEAISCLRDELTGGLGDLVWGGDWNQGLERSDHVGTPAGRSAVLALLSTLDLTVKTAGLDKHTVKGQHRSIDHIAVPAHWKSADATQLPAEIDGERLSDHDAYIVEVEL